jgi:hypothetical protein
MKLSYLFDRDCPPRRGFRVGGDGQRFDSLQLAMGIVV